MKDDYVATEHLLIALADRRVPAPRSCSTDAGADRRRRCARALTAVRGNRRVTSQDAESTYEALEKYSVDLTAGAPRTASSTRSSAATPRSAA